MSFFPLSRPQAYWQSDFKTNIWFTLSPIDLQCAVPWCSRRLMSHRASPVNALSFHEWTTHYEWSGRTVLSRITTQWLDERVIDRNQSQILSPVNETGYGWLTRAFFFVRTKHRLDLSFLFFSSSVQTIVFRHLT